MLYICIFSSECSHLFHSLHHSPQLKSWHTHTHTHTHTHIVYCIHFVYSIQFGFVFPLFLWPATGEKYDLIDVVSFSLCILSCGWLIDKHRLSQFSSHLLCSPLPYYFQYFFHFVQILFQTLVCFLFSCIYM